METKQEVIARAKELAEGTETIEKTELEQLKTLYYKFHNQEVIDAREAFVAAGGSVEEFVPEADTDEPAFREALQVIRQRRAEEMRQQEQERVKNLDRKLDILDRIKQMAQTPEEASQNYDEFKQLQQEFKEGGQVPPERATEIWKNFQLYCEQYYDLLKIGHEMREYDLRKNLEQKLLLCQQAEALSDVENVLDAFEQLQNLHQQWKETGPVAKEMRDDLWNRFKDASTVVNKRHQAYFEAIKAKEQENLDAKQALCQEIEDIDCTALLTFADWDSFTKKIQEIQAKWKLIGRAPQKDNNAIYERFREACDKFFQAKQAFFKSLREAQNEAIAKRKALVEKAEALKDSTEWKETAEILQKLQQEWKELTGSIPHKQSQQLWERFKGACDAFFAARKADWEAGREQRDADRKAMREKAKEARQRAIAGAQRHAEHLQNVIDGDRARLKRAYEKLQQEITTYENNIGFLSASSKKGNILVEQMEKKVAGLKADLKKMADKLKEATE